MRLVAYFILLLFSACQANVETTQEIEMYNGSGDMVGTAIFVEQSDGVEIQLKIEGLPAGFHGIHLHEYPLCEGPDFKSAGNHFNPEGKKHGLLHPDGAHLGDLPNVEADESGLIEVDLLLEDATMLDGKNSLYLDGGSSLIVTEKPDDGMSQPSGDSGARIICGVLQSDLNGDDNESPTDPTENDQEDEEEDNNDDLL